MHVFPYIFNDISVFVINIYCGSFDADFNHVTGCLPSGEENSKIFRIISQSYRQLIYFGLLKS